MGGIFSANVSPIPKTEIYLLDNKDEILDRSIDVTELKAAIKKVKNGKVPGHDDISKEHFKELPVNWKMFMPNL